MVVGLTAPSAEAAVAKVSGVTSVSADWYNSKLTVRWKAVRGTIYQVRWASSKAGLARAKPIAARVPRATSPTLNRCVTSYVQVRAFKGRVAGKWSTPKGLRFTNKRANPVAMTGTGITDGVTFSWPYTSFASRYRVLWNAAPFGRFPGAATYVGGGWFGQTARSATLKLPTVPKIGDKMMGVAYANPVYAQMQANNACKPTDIPHNQFIYAFPKAPDPGTGDKFRVGTYNVEANPTGARLATIADNIGDHGLQVVLLQEANAATAESVARALGSTWSKVDSILASDQQILYRNTYFDLVANNTFEVGPNPRPPNKPLVTPWARLKVKDADPAAVERSVIVSSVHFLENTAASAYSQKASTGVQARDAIAELARINRDNVPVIVGGDFRYKREPFCDEPACDIEAPPTFVRGGYYDAMAAVTKVNFKYPTNQDNHSTSVANASGVATRADYLMLKGFRGSLRYENVINRFLPGTRTTPSDHNLVLADVVLPAP
ncbi:hypothetical protein [Nocardioides marmoriginsengisoli]|uniref:hypothetical protein n=1 Tax=Nocardioides marmoriginsengisoli TaxID=661483 RepID=UPI0011CE14FD|nr:hypothetical protein [Nocardioides marmoriginsengisoli]